MADTTDIKTAQVSLQSKDHEELLDIIDDLRAQGISRYIDLPQLIVCGDQSSGKSSVLEAVSSLRFPTKDNLCTRFATELILRRGPESDPTVTIVPGDNRSEADAARLKAWSAPSMDINEFASLVEAAEVAMGLDHDAKAFSRDILRVELSGPKQPHLTLVDLPGLFHAGNKAQSEQDASSVKSLVLSYMEKARSIILAVISAKNDYANQIITKYARDLDPVGLRTLGIITKPDTLFAGSDSERAFVELAENKDVVFKLGWHVLKNRDYDSRHFTAEERDLAEEKFFSQGIWASFQPRHMGIASLKPRLSRVLKDQILTELPNLIRDVETGVKDCEQRLKKLGGSRVSLPEQRLHLLRVSQSFSSLVKAAIDGVYVESFFGDPNCDSEYNKRLRAVTQNTLLDFAEEMRLHGHAVDIVEESAEESAEDPDAAFADESDDSEAYPPRILRSKFISHVQGLIKRTRGSELPGTFNPQIVGELFFHSKPWKSIVETYMDQLFDSAKTTLTMVLDYTADPETANGLLRQIINPAFEVLKQELDAKAAEVLVPHQRGHPITYNHYLTDNLHKARAERWSNLVTAEVTGFLGVNLKKGSTYTGAFNVKALLEKLNRHAPDADMDHRACSEAIDCMLAYYKVKNITINPESFRRLIPTVMIG